MGERDGEPAGTYESHRCEVVEGGQVDPWPQ